MIQSWLTDEKGLTFATPWSNLYNRSSRANILMTKASVTISSRDPQEADWRARMMRGLASSGLIRWFLSANGWGIPGGREVRQILKRLLSGSTTSSWGEKSPIPEWGSGWGIGASTTEANTEIWKRRVQTKGDFSPITNSRGQDNMNMDDQLTNASNLDRSIPKVKQDDKLEFRSTLTHICLHNLSL